MNAKERVDRRKRVADARLARKMDAKTAASVVMAVYAKLLEEDKDRIYPMLKLGYRVDKRLYRALQTLLLDPRYAAAVELAGGPPAFVSRNRCGVPFVTPRGAVLEYAFFLVMPERFPRDD